MFFKLGKFGRVRGEIHSFLHGWYQLAVYRRVTRSKEDGLVAYFLEAFDEREDDTLSTAILARRNGDVWASDNSYAHLVNYAIPSFFFPMKFLNS
jgi:hypothetical protein